MGTQQVVDLLSEHLRQFGCHGVKMTGRGGTWTSPACIEFEVNGKRHIHQYWAGSFPDEKTAESALIDILAAIWKLPGDQARARIRYEREQQAAR